MKMCFPMYSDLGLLISVVVIFMVICTLQSKMVAKTVSVSGRSYILWFFKTHFRIKESITAGSVIWNSEAIWQ